MSAETLIADPLGDVEWCVADDVIPYADALAEMEQRAGAIAAGTRRERIWLLQHPPVITAGTSARPADLLDPGSIPVVPAGRGGQYTLHAPGQRVVYVMLDLNRRARDVRRLVASIEDWMIRALARLGVAAFTSSVGTGIWVGRPPAEAKVGAIGIRVRRWVTLHGASINVANDLSLYDAIVPCGIADHGVARLADLVPDTLPEQLMVRLDRALIDTAPAFLAMISDTKALEGANKCR